MSAKRHPPRMPARASIHQLAQERAAAVRQDVGREIRLARRERGLALVRVASAVGLSGSQAGRIERGLVRHVSVEALLGLAAAVGLDLSIRAFPAGSPVRDQAHLALLARLRGRLHASLRWESEVPLPIPGDLRAWDAVVTGRGWRLGVEAETRPRDVQALERRLALKQRDGETPLVVLLLLDSHHNRRLVRTYADELGARFPAPGRRTLELLAAGARPEASSIVLL